jgi:UDP-N-acetylglucosamine--N-acetylmuramyl-(pentapeptide) pyrophosphoryl-undecaprenol N-acetylglucosamine transferase
VHGRGGVAPQHRAQTIARVLLTGGGTGGHVYPAIAIAEALRERDPATEVLFVGTRGGLESSIVPKAGLPVAYVASRPLQRSLSLDALRTLGSNAVGVAQALGVVGRFGPDCVVATGGYVTFPVVLAARMLRTFRRGRPRIALLEPNAVAGLTNRLVEPFADETWLAHARTTAAGGRAFVTGTPVRASIARPLDRVAARAALGVDPARTTIVVMGGSQGARRINDAVAEMIAAGQLPDDWQIVQFTGERDAERARAAAAGTPAVFVRAYADDPAPAYWAADVMVARAGASTLAELAATGTPAILVPYPHATDDHQARNAEAVVAAGAARIVADDVLTGERLRAELCEALAPATLAGLRAAAGRQPGGDARARIVERIVALLGAGKAQVDS